MSSRPPASLEGTSDPGISHHVGGDGVASLVLEAHFTVLVPVHVPSPALGVSHASVNSSSELEDSLPGASVGSASFSKDPSLVLSELASSVVDEGSDSTLGFRLEIMVVPEVSGDAPRSTLLGGVSLEVPHNLLGTVLLDSSLGELLERCLRLLNIDGLGSDNGKREDGDDFAEHLVCV